MKCNGGKTLVYCCNYHRSKGYHPSHDNRDKGRRIHWNRVFVNKKSIGSKEPQGNQRYQKNRQFAKPSKKGLIKSRAIIVDSTHSYSKGNPETPTQILRRMTKSPRREIYQMQPKLAELFPDKPVEPALLEDEIEYTKQLVKVLRDKLTYKGCRKQYEKVAALLEDDKMKGIQSAEDLEATIGHKSKENSFFGYKNHLAINDERLITGIEVTTGRAADTKY